MSFAQIFFSYGKWRVKKAAKKKFSLERFFAQKGVFLRNLDTEPKLHGYGLRQGFFLVPLKGGIGSIFDPPNGSARTFLVVYYISGIFPANWGMDYATDPTF